MPSAPGREIVYRPALLLHLSLPFVDDGICPPIDLLLDPVAEGARFLQSLQRSTRRSSRRLQLARTMSLFRDSRRYAGRSHRSSFGQPGSGSGCRPSEWTPRPAPRSDSESWMARVNWSARAVSQYPRHLSMGAHARGLEAQRLGRDVVRPSDRAQAVSQLGYWTFPGRHTSPRRRTWVFHVRHQLLRPAGTTRHQKRGCDGDVLDEAPCSHVASPLLSWLAGASENWLGTPEGTSSGFRTRHPGTPHTAHSSLEVGESQTDCHAPWPGTSPKTCG